jgi:hypothetical protein
MVYGAEQHEAEEGLGPIRLMVIGQVDLNDLNDTIRGLESRLNREINYLVFDGVEYQRRKTEEDPFLVEVLKGRRAILIGTDDGV